MEAILSVLTSHDCFKGRRRGSQVSLLFIVFDAHSSDALLDLRYRRLCDRTVVSSVKPNACLRIRDIK